VASTPDFIGVGNLASGAAKIFDTIFALKSAADGCH
jgi:hypothetical protein